MDGTGEGIDKQGATQTLPLKGVIDGQTAYANSGHGRKRGNFLLMLSGRSVIRELADAKV
jgi:hypothetical protein